MKDVTSNITTTTNSPQGYLGFLGTATIALAMSMGCNGTNSLLQSRVITIPSFPSNTLALVSSNQEKKKKSFKDRYQKIGQSEWFKESYQNMSLGDRVSIES